MIVDCTGLSDEFVLTTLYNKYDISKKNISNCVITIEEAEEYLERTKCIHTIKGILLDLNFETFPQMDSEGYDNSINENNAMKRIIDETREYLNYLRDWSCKKVHN